ncbi:MAG: DUF3305 domain-containing protein [Pseudomonadota bacterium]
MERTAEMNVGVVLRRAPGVTRWQKEVWSLAGVIPHAPPAEGRVLLDDGDVIEVHAATLTLELHRKETEALVQNLSAQVPSVWVGLRGAGRPEPVSVTASPFEAGCYDIDDEDRVEKVAMPPVMHKWIAAFIATHHVDEKFVKRRRDKHREGAKQDGIGDARIAQGADVWRNPASMRGRR